MLPRWEGMSCHCVSHCASRKSEPSPLDVKGVKLEVSAADLVAICSRGPRARIDASARCIKIVVVPMFRTVTNQNRRAVPERIHPWRELTCPIIEAEAGNSPKLTLVI